MGGMQGMNCLVSINCITYNHEKYIAQTIESFLMQETNFDFEILIHDDASTDNTQSIIKEYELKYPSKIKVIYQTENQYSQGKKPSMLNAQRASGKYIALCEGDDYWTSPHKLQKQIDYMENNDNCSMCVHAGYLVNSVNENEFVEYRSASGNKLFNTSEIIKRGGALFLTNSIVYKSVYINERPLFLENSPVGDYPLAINLSLLGEVYYIDECMSAYRQNVAGSWSERTFVSPDITFSHYNKMLIMLDELNEYTNFKYDKVINATKKDNYLPMYLASKKIESYSKLDVIRLYNKLSIRQKIILLLDSIHPNIVSILKSFFRSVK